MRLYYFFLLLHLVGHVLNILKLHLLCGIFINCQWLNDMLSQVVFDTQFVEENDF